MQSLTKTPFLFADHYVSGLHCKIGCPDKLDFVNGEFKDDYLAEHYNYLQYAYFKGKNVIKNFTKYCTRQWLRSI